VELALGSGPADSKTLVSTSPRRLDAAEFFGDGKDAFIITTDRHWDELRTALPRETTVLAECPLFLRSERLLLVGLPPPAPATARRESNSQSTRH
jgi:hypothetical protein